MRNFYIAASLSLLFSIQYFHKSYAQVYPADFAQVRVTNGIIRPTAMAFAPDGRIFVLEQAGNVRVIKENTLLETPFVSLAVSSVGERGLVGIAIDPDFLTNKYIYLYYTVEGTPDRNRISRFTAEEDVAQSGSETLILDLDPLSTATIHNGGAMHFGNDGTLYVAVGENANVANAQDLDTYHGKLLRINKDGSVPEGNPFPTGSEQRRRVWAYGLRNPFTFSIDPENGKIFVNDVGGGLWEEINDATEAGTNFGWPTTEGTFNQETYPEFTNPVYAYAHGDGDGVGCAITGGTFFNPSVTNYPAEYIGKFFFQDSCNDWINSLDISDATAVRSPFATSVSDNSLGITTGPDGNIYYLSRAGQSLHKIIYNNTTTPFITNHPSNATVGLGQPVTFTVMALGTSPLAYQWQKNEVNIPNATNATFSITQTTELDAGQYRAIVTNAVGEAISDPATLMVIPNRLPVAEIISPVSGTTYVAGSTIISFSGKGTDEEDGPLPDEALSWEINFQHNDHKHDQPPIEGVSSGTFEIPNEGETSDNVWYRIILTVTDLNGLTGKDSVDILPLKSTLSFETNPAGFKILLDGQPFNTPGSVVSVEGILRTIDVVSPQTVNDQIYQFTSWNHGGDKHQSIPTPESDVTYTANFTPVENTKSFYRAINLNGPALSIDGHNWEASADVTDFSYVNGQTLANLEVALDPATDEPHETMIRSSIWGNTSMALAAVPEGSYEIWLYVWEDNFPATFSFSLEGTEAEMDFNSGSAGSWTKLGPFLRTISDGTINLAVIDGAEANFSGIEIWSLTDEDEVVAVAGDEKKGSLQLSAYPNPFSDKVSITFKTTEFSPTQLTLYDSRGMRLSNVFEGIVPTGINHQIDFERVYLKDGMYFLQLINGKKVKSLKLVITR